MYDIWASLHLIENMDFPRAGDVWSWYYNEFFEQRIFNSPSTPGVNNDIAMEMMSFEKEILSNLSSKNVKIGLSDFVSGKNSICNKVGSPLVADRNVSKCLKSANCRSQS